MPGTEPGPQEPAAWTRPDPPPAHLPWERGASPLSSRTTWGEEVIPDVLLVWWLAAELGSNLIWEVKKGDIVSLLDHRAIYTDYIHNNKLVSFYALVYSKSKFHF